MAKYVCQVCSCVYDEEQGEPDRMILAGTAYEDLPETWRCRVCGAKAKLFKPAEAGQNA